MSRHAVVLAGEVIGFRDETPNVDQALLAPNKPRLLPVILDRPEHDPEREILTGPLYDVETDQVVERYTVAERPVAERQAAMRSAINALLDRALTGGYTVETGVMAGQVLQTRGIDDRANWLVSQASYSAAVAGGQGAALGAQFRTADNATFTVSNADGLAVLLAMAAWGATRMGHSWALKDAVEAAESHAALDLIDIAAGW